MLWVVGERHAAGAPISEPSVEADEWLGRVMESLRVSLGKRHPYDV